MAGINYLPLAIRDIDRVYRWYARRSPSAAKGFIASIERTQIQVVANPLSLAEYEVGHRFCRLDRYPYLFVYRIFFGDPLVVAVAHAKRSKRFWQKRSS